MIIDAVKGYPKVEDWKLLEEGLEGMIDAYASTRSTKMCSVNDRLAVVISELSAYHELLFHKECQSYTIIILAPFHENENRNLFSKLDDACNSLSKYAKEEDGKIIFFIHLPENAPVVACRQWVSDYFQQYPMKPLTGVILYQPTIAKDLEKEVDFIHHLFTMTFNEEKFRQWAMKDTIHLTPVVGIAGDIPTTKHLVVTTDQGDQLYDIGDRYIFQKGNHFLKQYRKQTVQSKAGPLNLVPAFMFML